LFEAICDARLSHYTQNRPNDVILMWFTGDNLFIHESHCHTTKFTESVIVALEKKDSGKNTFFA